MATKHKIGAPPEGRLGVYDVKGNMRAHVGRTATPATCARFLGHHHVKLGKVEGRPAWIEQRRKV